MFKKLLPYFIVIFGVLFAEPLQVFAGGTITKFDREEAKNRSGTHLLRDRAKMIKEEGWEQIPNPVLARVISFLSLDDMLALASTNSVFKRKVWLAFLAGKKSITLSPDLLNACPSCVAEKHHVTLLGGTLNETHFLPFEEAKYLRSLSLLGFNEGWNAHIVNGRVFPSNNTAGLLSLLRRRKGLVALDLSECDIPSLALQPLPPLFTSLTSLNLKGTQVSCDSAQGLAPYVKGLTRFGVSLDCNVKSKKKAKADSLFTSLSGLKHFDLTVKGVRYMRLGNNFMTGITSLTSLYIKNEEGGLCKSHALVIAQTCTTLEELALIHFGKGKDKKGFPLPCIDCEVATIISEKLRRLNKLYLVNHFAPESGIRRIGGISLAKMTQLTSLSLYFHKLDNEVVKHMVQSLTNLRELDLRNNWRVDNVGFGDNLVSSIKNEAVDVIVRHLPKLTYLGFSGSCVSDAELENICLNLKSLKTLAMDDGFISFVDLRHLHENFSFQGACSINPLNLPKLREVSLSWEQAIRLKDKEINTLRSMNPDITFKKEIDPLIPEKPHPMDILDDKK